MRGARERALAIKLVVNRLNDNKQKPAGEDRGKGTWLRLVVVQLCDDGRVGLLGEKEKDEEGEKHMYTQRG